VKNIKLNIQPFRFQCNRCGKCCTALNEGVPLYLRDIDQISSSLGLGREEFIKTFCNIELKTVEAGNRKMQIPLIYLKVESRTCVFYKNERCSVHNHKPYLCAASPFITLHFQDEEVKSVFKSSCEGYGMGPLYTKENIERILSHESYLEEEDFRAYQNGFYDELLKIYKESITHDTTAHNTHR